MNPAKEFKVIIPGKQSNTPKLDIGKFPCEFSKAPNSTLKIERHNQAFAKGSSYTVQEKEGRSYTGKLQGSLQGYYMALVKKTDHYEAIPIRNWHTFTKDITYKTYTYEEAEKQTEEILKRKPKFKVKKEIAEEEPLPSSTKTPKKTSKAPKAQQHSSSVSSEHEDLDFGDAGEEFSDDEENDLEYGPPSGITKNRQKRGKYELEEDERDDGLNLAGKEIFHKIKTHEGESWFNQNSEEDGEDEDLSDEEASDYFGEGFRGSTNKEDEKETGLKKDNLIINSKKGGQLAPMKRNIDQVEGVVNEQIGATKRVKKDDILKEEMVIKELRKNKKILYIDFLKKYSNYFLSQEQKTASMKVLQRIATRNNDYLCLNKEYYSK